MALDKSDTPTPMGDARALEQEFERLLETPAGSVIYDQLARIVAEWQAIEKRVALTYTSLLRLLLEDFAAEPTSEHVLVLAGQLIQLQPRHMASPTFTTATPAEFAKQLAGNNALHAALRILLERLSEPSPVQHLPRPVDVFDVTSEGDRNDAEKPRANVVDLSPLARKQGEADRITGLALQVREAITRSKQFGDLLQIEMDALRHADSVMEINALRQILIGGIEELQQGQQELAGSLKNTSEYLHIVESDSERLYDELHKAQLLSLTDEFTGLHNRRAFMRRLEEEISRAQRYATPLVLALLDLDEFKTINDTYGHPAGDHVLRSYAEHLLSTFRHHDMVARYGGEEFAVMLLNTTLKGAQAALHKLQKRVAAGKCEYDGRLLSLPTFSAGLTLYVPGETLTTIIKRADTALYRAKRLGRNCIELELSSDQPAAAIEPGKIS